MRVSVGAVNVATGNFAYFDNTQMRLRAGAFHGVGRVAAGFRRRWKSTASITGTAASCRIRRLRNRDGEPRRDTLAFQVDLWSARGPVPDSIVDVMGRVKDIQYSSRTRMVTDMMQRSQRYRNVLRHVLDTYPRSFGRAIRGASSLRNWRARSATT